MKHILLLDIDDVIWNLLEAWVSYLNKHYDTNVDWETINEWDMSKSFPTLTAEQLYGLFHDLDFWMTVKPIEGATEGIIRLQKKYDVYLLSATDVSTISVKFVALKDKFPMIDERHIIFCKNKQLVFGDYLVDDNINNLIGGEYKKILFTAPHNKNDKLPDNIIRCNNWSELVYLLM